MTGEPLILEKGHGISESIQGSDVLPVRFPGKDASSEETQSMEKATDLLFYGESSNRMTRETDFDPASSFSCCDRKN